MLRRPVGNSRRRRGRWFPIAQLGPGCVHEVAVCDDLVHDDLVRDGLVNDDLEHVDHHHEVAANDPIQKHLCEDGGIGVCRTAHRYSLPV